MSLCRPLPRGAATCRGISTAPTSCPPASLTSTWDTTGLSRVNTHNYCLLQTKWLIFKYAHWALVRDWNRDYIWLTINCVLNICVGLCVPRQSECPALVMQEVCSNMDCPPDQYLCHPKVRLILWINGHGHLVSRAVSRWFPNATESVL